ncbi:unnamed protein product [Dovyalis caffra]|uniref:Wall-associated receptor kinase C-terminal domain-containing protein n=1 Tax=Dovyalis caffra TaxID=77055 RepID=A0AAV1S424_9ROSI|nr:unnamed protein product [Dovyalis caffra]
MKKGFEVRWKVDKAACEECTNSSGVCGIDPLLKFRQETELRGLGIFLQNRKQAASWIAVRL